MIEVRLAALKESKPHEYIVRFVFGGLCTALAGVVAKKFGPVIGGCFLAFPAIFPAGASLIESNVKRKKREIGADGTNRGRMAAALDSSGATLGCVALATFAVVTWRSLDEMKAALGLCLASLAWLIVACGLWKLWKSRAFAGPRRNSS